MLESQPVKVRSTQDYIVLLVKGFIMGAADVVPGVSGGTVAFITGIYNELIHSIKSIGPAALPILFKQGLMAFWRHINGNFLLTVFVGILLSVKTLASVISYCMENYPVLVWAFFTGLILASVILLGRQFGRWTWRDIGICLLGCVFVYAVSVARPAQLPDSPWILFGGGFIAICAMILPGISGSFILLLLGLYGAVIEAVKSLDMLSIASFGFGCICGLLVFSRFLSWLMDRYFKTTVAVLIGFLIGSLNVTWPWKHTLEAMINRHGEEVPLVQKNLMPWQYEQITGADSQVLYVILLLVAGFALVLLTEFFARKLAR